MIVIATKNTEDTLKVISDIKAAYWKVKDSLSLSLTFNLPSYTTYKRQVNAYFDQEEPTYIHLTLTGCDILKEPLQALTPMRTYRYPSMGGGGRRFTPEWYSAQFREVEAGQKGLVSFALRNQVAGQFASDTVSPVSGWDMVKYDMVCVSTWGYKNGFLVYRDDRSHAMFALSDNYYNVYFKKVLP